MKISQRTFTSLMRSGAVIFTLVSLLLWRGELQACDTAVSEFVNRFHQPLVNSIVIALTHLNSPPALLILSLLVVATLAAKKAWRPALVFLGGLGGTALATSLIKALVDRSRPIDRLVEIHSPSFPSWHASTSMALGILLFWLLAERGGAKAAWILLWPLAIGLSRIWLNAHWCSDVLAGWGLGAFITAGVVLLFGTQTAKVSEE